jgi:hypothetical protein
MLIESFLDYLRYERNYSEKTVLAYGEDIKQLQEFAQEEYGRFNPLEVEAVYSFETSPSQRTPRFLVVVTENLVLEPVHSNSINGTNRLSGGVPPNDSP